MLTMETDELEMCKEDFQKWIRERVKKRLISAAVAEKYNLLESLLKKREEQLTRLLKLSNSVAAFEAFVKKQYLLLGWEYTGTDSDDDAKDIADCIHNYVDSIRHSGNFDANGDRTTKHLGIKSSNQASSASPTSNLLQNHREHDISSLKKIPVVVLERLPRRGIRSVRPPSPRHSAEDLLSDADSDTQWGPDGYTSDSDFSIESYSPGSKKRKRKRIRNTVPKKRLRKSQEKTTTKEKSDTESPPKASGDGSAKNDGEKLPASQSAGAIANAENKTNPPPQVSTDSVSKDRGEKLPASQLPGAQISAIKPPAQIRSDGKVEDKGEKSSTSQSAGIKCDTKSQTPVSTDCKDKEKKSASAGEENKAGNSKEKTSTQQVKSMGASSSSVKALSQSSVGAKNTPQSNSPGPLTVNTEVLARHKALKWIKGKIIEIISTEDKLRYKVSFEKGKKIVSGHHIALLSSPKVNELDVGSRVVIKRSTEPLVYCPGIMAEIPSRKNRSRFLIIADDHTPSYCGMPQFHQVYKPLKDPLNDIKDEAHKVFLRDYIKSWPFPAQTSYRVGQKLNAEYEGVQQKCEVLDVDCSLIQVVFEKDRHKEYIYRGSLRLEHMIHMRKMQTESEKKSASGKG